MIILPNKEYEINTAFPSDVDWYNNGNIIIDENTENGRILMNKIIENSPFFDLVFDFEGNVIDVVPTERPPSLPPKPNQDDYLLDLDYRLSMIELGL